MESEAVPLADGNGGRPFFFRTRNDDPKVLRQETYRDSKGICEVTLSLSAVFLSYTIMTLRDKTVTPTRSVPVATFLAATVRDGCLLCVSYYPLDRKNATRRRCTLEFLMNSPQHALSWSEAINALLTDCSVPSTPLPRRHILVLVNPFGGTKKAPVLWRTVVEPMWREAGLTYDMMETQYSGHAKEIARRVDLTKYDAMATLSGDGLFWELLNGLMMRPDWKEAAKVPIALMPGGSGNALAFAAGMGDVETAAFAVARGRASPFDVATVAQEKHRFMSFIVIAWGIVADVDFESERFRWMGGARFTVSAVQRIAGLRHYKGRFSYYPDTSWNKEPCGPKCTRCLAPTWPGSVAPQPHDAQWEAAAVSLDGKRGGGSGPFSGMEKAALPPGPPTPLLDALAAGNEEGWVTVESDRYVMFCASNATHIAADMKTAPHAHWSDGCWDIVVVKDISKAKLLKLFLSIEKGEHVDSEDVTYLKVRAFRLEPDTSVQGSFLDVDGERMPSYGPTVSEMHRGLLNLITPLAMDAQGVEEVRTWIASVLGLAEAPEFPSGLKDGIVLCKLANALKPGSVAKINPGKLPFHRLENIESFTKFVRSLGIQDRNSFVSVDLHDEKDLKAVVICLLNVKRETGYGNVALTPRGNVFDKLE